jgi:D-alanyl-D-alanine carboxypeptidase (penicillin-binding protein 5/6)
MISKLMLLLSITLNTIGFHGSASKVDANYLDTKSSQIVKTEKVNVLPLPPIKMPPTVRTGVAKEIINARHYILIDPETGIVFAKKDETARIPIASTTKIMTAIIVLENFGLDEVVTISAKANAQIGSDGNLRSGEQLTVQNILKALMLQSANDSAYAFAEHLNKDGETGITQFVQMMNDKAKELGMKDTEYHDPAGLDVTGYSSAYDLTLITRYALQNPTFAEIVKMKSADISDVTGKIKHSYQNSNRLVNEWNYLGAIGVKTGYMPEAGHCLVSAVKRDEHTLIAVILNTFADTAPASAEEARDLQNWGWENINWND